MLKRMDMWNQQKYEELVVEAERSDKRLKSFGDKDDGHKVRIFTRLVMQGRLRDATRFITDQAGGGVLKPEDVLSDGSMVLETLKKKHPAQFQPDQEMLLLDQPLPLQVIVHVMADHMEKKNQLNKIT
uniref:Transient receptor potential cation channel subfamily M member 6 n=1 Tax=Lygus hesperus TaxID=30085 RepID=A0A0A9XX31_LYGHE